MDWLTNWLTDWLTDWLIDKCSIVLIFFRFPAFLIVSPVPVFQDSDLRFQVSLDNVLSLSLWSTVHYDKTNLQNSRNFDDNTTEISYCHHFSQCVYLINMSDEVQKNSKVNPEESLKEQAAGNGESTKQKKNFPFWRWDLDQILLETQVEKTRMSLLHHPVRIEAREALNISLTVTPPTKPSPWLSSIVVSTRTNTMPKNGPHCSNYEKA